MNPTSTDPVTPRAGTQPLPLPERVWRVLTEAEQIRTTIRRSVRLLRGTVADVRLVVAGFSPDPS